MTFVLPLTSVPLPPRRQIVMMAYPVADARSTDWRSIMQTERGLALGPHAVHAAKIVSRSFWSVLADRFT